MRSFGRARAISLARARPKTLSGRPVHNPVSSFNDTNRGYASKDGSRHYVYKSSGRVQKALQNIAIEAAPSIGAMGVVAAKMAHGGAKTLLRGSGTYRLGGRRLAPGVGPPMFAGGGKCRVRHREYLTDIHTGPLVSGSTGFALTRFDINAGLQHTFPWFSGLGQLYEEYKPKGIVFEFKSTCGNAFSSTNNSLGTVIMATEYNAGFPNFTSKIQMENYKGAVSAAPTRNQYHAIECAGSQNPLSWLYTRSTEVPDGQTPQVYDIGSFQIATVGMQAAGVNIGELWVSYDIELDKPRFSGEGAGDTALWRFSGARLTDSTTPRIFGNLPLVAVASDLGLRWGGQPPGADYNTIYFPQKPIKTRYTLTFNYEYGGTDQKTQSAGNAPIPFIQVSALGTGVHEVANFWQQAPVPILHDTEFRTTCSNPAASLAGYYGPVSANVGDSKLGVTMVTTKVIDVDAYVVGNTNRIDFTSGSADSALFDATWPTGFGWNGSMLVTTVPSELYAHHTLGVPSGPEPETTGCETNPHSFYIPTSMRKALKQCELNEQELEGKGEGKEEKVDDGDDEQEEEDEVVPSKRNRFLRSYASANLEDNKRAMKALRDANNLIPPGKNVDTHYKMHFVPTPLERSVTHYDLFGSDDEDEPEPLPEEKKAPVSSLLSLSSMPPPSSVPSGLSTSSSSSLSTVPPPGATILTPRTTKRGWFA